MTDPNIKKLALPPRESGKRVVLNLVNAGAKLAPVFDPQHWQEVIASKEVENAHLPVDLRDLSLLPDESFDALWNVSSLCYLYAHEVPMVLKECYRILRQGGTLMFNVQDLQRIAQPLGQGKLEQELYRAPAGPITAIDLIYGYRRAMVEGRKNVEIHTGFTANSIAHKLAPLGFGEIEIIRKGWVLQVMARKIPASPPDKPMIRIREEEINDTMRKRDQIDKAPEWMKITPEGVL